MDSPLRICDPTHVKLIIDILKREKLYVSENKLNFLAREIRILGRIVDTEGIRMDPDKVDAILVRALTVDSKSLGS
ncbi:hypothetical protein BT96DRAFT_1010708 [Gymnopus androsaceus JB14]|uniref:Reverse transcriptase domain-containing protein n=1 Tax=Gymnopus androsaceus JB14 TaxID=1447944 RepID=A0A6A4GAC1_9AGAR|nr:hypothetical protein BT96DRAFT_1010708 [Gymnopus androsaceus JB14]